MVPAIIFAHVWGVVQLIILGSLARTVRLRTVFLAMAVGLYACPPVAVLLQVAWTRPAAWLTGASLSDVVGTASYTVDPFIEQIILLLPLTVLLSTIPSIRRQWSITDCVLTSAAVGSGFGLAEALYRYSTSADQAYRSAGDAGWTLAATSIGDVLNPRWIPGAWYSLTSWFPAGAPLGVNNYYVNIGLAYGAIGGLGLGLMMLHRGMLARMVGAVLLLYTAVDHATINAWLRDVLSAPLTSGHMLGLMSIAALAVALWLDHRRQRIGDSVELLLAAEQSVAQRPLGTLRAAVSRLPWSLTWVNGFVRMRRAYTSARASEPAEPDNLRATVVDARDRVDQELVQVESPPLLPRSWLKTLRRPAIIGWLLLMTPCVVWFVVGGRPATAWVQDTMITGPVWIAVLVFSVATQVWLAWSVIVGVRTWQKARWLPLGDDAAVTGLRIAGGIGAIGLGGYALLRALFGDSPADAILNAHTQEAISGFGLGPAGFLANSAGSIFPQGGSSGGGGSLPAARKSHQDPERPRKQPDPEKQQEPQDPERMSRRDREEAKRAAKKDADSGWKEAQKYKDAVDRANRKAAEAKDLEDRAARARREQSAADAEAKDHAERAGRKFDAAGDAENAELARQRANEADRVSKESADRAERIERPGSGKRQGEADRQPQQKPEQKPQETKPPNALDAQRKQTKAAASQSADAIAETNYAFAINVGLPAYIAPGGGTLAAGYLPVALAGYAAETHFANLAGDPPRDDFPSVSKYSPASDTSVTVSDFQSALHAYAVGGEGLCAALYALVTSLERHDGVRLALEGENGSAMYSTADLRTFDRLQRDAIAHNARVSSAFVDRLVSNRGPLNAGYLSSIPTSESDETSPVALDKGARRTQLEESWRLGKADIQRRFFLSDTGIAAIESRWRESIECADDASAPAGALLDEKWESTMQAMSVELLRLADVYESTTPSSA